MSHNHEHQNHHCSCHDGKCENVPLEHEHEHDGGDSTSWIKPVISLTMLVAGIVMTHAGVAWFQGWTRIVWYALAWLPTGTGVLREAVEAAREGEVFSEFMLMTVASIGAFAIGEYPEAVAVMALYCIGEALQDHAVERARGNIKSLIAFRPDHAVIVNGTDRVTVDPAQVKVGDTIEVKAGERVPIDGMLLERAATFDTAALTGESVPRTIEADGEVLAGMISNESTVHIKASRPASESAMSRILAIVEDANEHKAPSELFIRRFARIYTPIVVGLALLVVVLPWLYSLVFPMTDYHFTDWLHRALIFLVISCPCALVISIPLSYYAGIGAASRQGILFKGGNYLDAIADIDTVAFDKTGTLTTGQFGVSEVQGLTDEQVSIVAAIEQHSPHPIAQAIIAFSQPAAIDVTDMKNIAGYGLSATVKGERWLVGTTRLLASQGVTFPDSLKDTVGTLVAVSIAGQYAGHLLLRDEPKEDAAAAIAELQQQNILTVLLSGDKQALVQDMADRLGMGKGYGDLLPQDKAEHIQQLKEKDGKLVAFVGDGMNDAPVLATSDVGIAMGALGSDMAIETADVVIQTDQPSRVADAIELGRRTQRIVKQNITFAIGVKVLVMALGVAGVANLWEAVGADVGAALLCVLNSLRLMRTR